MKHIKEITSPAGLDNAHEQLKTDQTKQVVTEETINFVNRVVKTILANSPAWSMSLKSSDSIDDYKQQLIKGFMENDVTQMSQVELGLKRIRKEPSNFLPSVGQFISWCLPSAESVGCPDLEDAYYEACHYHYSRKTLSHPCVAYALAKITSYELANKPESKTKDQFAIYYQQAIEAYYFGDDLAEYVERFTRNKNSNKAKLTDMRGDTEYQKRNQEVGLKHLSKIRQKLKKHKAS